MKAEANLANTDWSKFNDSPRRYNITILGWGMLITAFKNLYKKNSTENRSTETLQA